jgi:hypothetical protein
MTDDDGDKFERVLAEAGARAAAYWAAREESERREAERMGEPPDDADVDHAAGCLRLRPQRQYLGERTSGEKLWRLRCAGCGAERVYVRGRPVEASARPGPRPPWPPETVLARRAERMATGQTYGDKAVADALSAEGPTIDESTVRRYRREAEKRA